MSYMYEKLILMKCYSFPRGYTCTCMLTTFLHWNVDPEKQHEPKYLLSQFTILRCMIGLYLNEVQWFATFLQCQPAKRRTHALYFKYYEVRSTKLTRVSR
jgi:hypothetical protein